MTAGDIDRGPCPFRFENSWLSTPSFWPLVETWWTNNRVAGWPRHGLMMKLKALQMFLRSWNNQHREATKLPSLISQLRELDNIGNRIQLSVEQLSTSCLLREQIEQLTAQEHIQWRLRSKPKWFMEGDENTCFFNVLPSTIALNQLASVENRQILDASLLAKELVDDWFHETRKGVIIKLYLEKAFDTVDWDFLDTILQAKGFGVIYVFEQASGLSINLSKSELLGIHISDDDLDWMVTIFGCKKDNGQLLILAFPLVGTLN
ncbi:reverse transcriptase [Cucumis melo var. makuwa]|uniref:Reverse transcriptase n=1 Tax=Cucumis melo var. makuwa TaxID=1194695 RepID=A0A5D3D3Q8_CUCMM|nr:reverse transcriptase [Cucumis melo var. makuwa]